MKSIISRRLFSIPVVLFFTFLLTAAVMADTYTATTMRLLHYEGTVEIEDSSGKSSLVMENIRFNSGDSMHTGAASSASVGLDSSKIVTLDENTKVQFTKNSKTMELSLSEGSFFLDVSEKLGNDESLDIKTSTMAVGIRGTVVVFSTYPVNEYQNRLKLKSGPAPEGSDQNTAGQTGTGQNAADTEGTSLSSLEEQIMQASADGGVVSMIGVLEGNVRLDYKDESGKSVSLDVSGGQKATLLDSNDNGMADLTPEVNEVTAEDLFDSADKMIEDDPALQERLKNSGFNHPVIKGNAGADSSYPANGDWTISSPVTIVAQSASKMFDGQPLTRKTDVLVQGLPAGFTCKTSAGGSQTDAGSSDNPVDSYAIYNANDENVTSHFKDIECISGKLTVDPAPLTAWSGTAEKVYDGTPLTSTETKLTFSPGYEKINFSQKNLSYVVTENRSVSAGTAAGAASSPSAPGQTSGLDDSQVLYGICGVVLVHGSNPITEEIKEIELAAGQKLTVHLSDKDNEESIEYNIETITEEQIPEDILRIYSDNPDILTQACAETKWNPDLINERIKNLPPLETETSDVNGVKMNSQTSENLMEDCTNVRITIDTEGTNYNNRALSKEEAHYTPMKADPSIKIIPDASITDVGTVSNTFTIDWGSAKKSNYNLVEKPGTLTVTPAPAVVTTGSAEKEYDGTPLTNDEASISGLVNNETAVVTATGSITNVGSETNTYSIDWGSAKAENYAVSSNTGTLKITANKTKISIKVSVSGKTYDGKPLNIDTVVTGGASAVSASAAETNTGSDGSQSNGSQSNGSQSDGSQSNGSQSDGSQDELSNVVTVEGLPSGYTFKAHITGSRTDAGTSDLTIESYQVLDKDEQDVSDQFSNIEIVEGTLTIDPAPVTVSTGSASKEYDSTPLTSSEVSVSGIVDADKEEVKVTPTGSITDVGTAENTYTIDWGKAKSSNYTVSESIGTLEVTENSTEITLTAVSFEKTYDGTPLTADGVTAVSLPEGFSFTASASGSLTDAGTGDNKVDSYKILDSDGNDVTAYFSNIKTADGTLTVNPAAVTVSTGSASKEYDGTSLTSSEASISGLIETEKDGVTVTATGSITDVGTAENTYSIEWGEVKSSNYTVSETIGTLEITQNTAEITFKAPSDSKTYDGTALEAGAVTVTGLPEPLSFTASASGSQTDAGSSEASVASYKILDADENDVTSYFSNIKTEKGTLTVNPVSAAVTTGSASKEYDGKELTSSEASITGLIDAEKDKVTVTADGAITKVGSAENTYTISWGEVKSSNYTLTENTGTLTVTANNTEITFKAASSSKTYDGTALTDESVTVDGELPADHFTISEVTGSQTDVGSSTNTISSYKILNAGEEDVTEYFTNIKTEDGTLTVTKNSTPITFTSASASKTYDGTPVSDAAVTVTGLPEGFTYQASAVGKGTDVGSYTNKFDIVSSSSAEDEYGNPVIIANYYSILKDGKDVTDYFTNVSITEGTLTVSPAALTVTTESKSKKYDGSPLNGTVSVSGLADADQDKVTVTATASITDVGSAESTYSLSWGTAKSTNYTLSESIGTLEVTKNDTKITFTTATAEKDYDGTSLYAPGVTVEGLPEGLTYVASGGGFVSHVDAGTYPNQFTAMNYEFEDENGNMFVGWRSARINDADGNDVTDNFTNLKFIEGTLTIHPLTVLIDLKSPVFDYDGRTHGNTPKATFENGPHKGESPELYTMMSNDAGDCRVQYIISEGIILFVSIDGNGPDAGTHTLSCAYEFSSETDDFKETNYKVNITGNTLTINKIKAVVTTGSAEGPSGTMYPVTNDEASITGLAEIDQEYVIITATGKQTFVGSSTNTYSIQWGTSDHPVNKDNYIIEENLGTLTMFNAAITPPLGSAPKASKSPASNTSDTGSSAEKETETGTGTGNKDGSSSADQTGENTDNKDSANKDSAANGSSADQANQNSEDKDSGSDQTGETSENKDSTSSDGKDSTEEQANKDSDNTGKETDSSEESKKDADSSDDEKNEKKGSGNDSSSNSSAEEKKNTEAIEVKQPEEKKIEEKKPEEPDSKKSQETEEKK